VIADWDKDIMTLRELIEQTLDYPLENIDATWFYLVGGIILFGIIGYISIAVEILIEGFKLLFRLGKSTFRLVRPDKKA
jgi:hypothetical protein